MRSMTGFSALSLTLALTSMSLALACTGASAQSGAADRTISIAHDGRARSSILHVPPSYVEGSPMPLVLLLHGGGGNGAQAQASYRMDPVADREGFLVAYPNGTGRLGNLLTWNAANCCSYAFENDVDDVGFLAALIDEIERTYSVDPRRIYATGMSNGGMMTYRLGCRMADRLAAIAPVAGALNETTCTPADPLPALVFHGTDDQHVPYNGGVGPETLYPRVDKSVQSAVDFWVARNLCETTPVTDTSQSGNVITTTYGGGIRDTEVVLVTIVDGGHAWPGGAGSATGDVPTQEISASELIWAFFARHPKVSEPAGPDVRVVSPNGGEKPRRGSLVDVAWVVDGTGDIEATEVWLSSDSGATYPTRLATIDDPAARQFAWTVPTDLAKGKHYRIRVTVTTREGLAGADASDGDFRIRKRR